MKHLARIVTLAVVSCLAVLFIPAFAQTDGICFLTVLKASDSGYAQQQNLVINDAAEWQAMWEKIFANTNVKPPLPEVDFTRRTIVAVFQGVQPSTGYAISIEGIVETEASLEVMVKEFLAHRCVVAPKLTRPLHIVEIEKTNKVFVFHVRQKTLCK